MFSGCIHSFVGPAVGPVVGGVIGGVIGPLEGPCVGPRVGGLGGLLRRQILSVNDFKIWYNNNIRGD